MGDEHSIDRGKRALLTMIDILENGNRVGSEVDIPEGTRCVIISDTLALELAYELKELLHEDS